MHTNNRAHLEDVVQNADLYIANQAVSSQLAAIGIATIRESVGLLIVIATT